MRCRVVSSRDSLRHESRGVGRQRGREAHPGGGQSVERPVAAPPGRRLRLGGLRQQRQHGSAARGPLVGREGVPRGPVVGAVLGQGVESAAGRRDPLDPLEPPLRPVVVGAGRPTSWRASSRSRRACCGRGRRLLDQAVDPRQHPVLGGRLCEPVAGELLGRRPRPPGPRRCRPAGARPPRPRRTRCRSRRLWSCTQSSMRANRSVRNRCCEHRRGAPGRRPGGTSGTRPAGAAPPAGTARRSCPSGR